MSAESIENVGLLHVSQKIDSELNAWSEKYRKVEGLWWRMQATWAFGKTERLRWLEEVARKSGIFHIFLSVEQDYAFNIKWIFESGLKQINEKDGFMGRLRSPGYVKEIKRSLKQKKEPVELGILASVMLKEKAPSYILLDNIDCGDKNFLDFLVSLVNNLKAESLLCFTGVPLIAKSV